MPMLSDDDLDIRDLSDEELDLAWDLWFDLAQTTNDDDPLYTHGVFQCATFEPASPLASPAPSAGDGPGSPPDGRGAIRMGRAGTA
jgi:hypothetical protein